MFTERWIREGDGGGQNRRKCLAGNGLVNMSICLSAHGLAIASWMAFLDIAVRRVARGSAGNAADRNVRGRMRRTIVGFRLGCGPLSAPR